MPSLRLAAAALLLASARLAAQQPDDAAYTAAIRELTPKDTAWKFSTELVDHLPASATVPTPLKVLGYVPGTVGRLSYVADINRYFRAVAAASPRVKVVSMGMSDEGREMILAIVADDSVIARLDDYKAMLAKVADPRGLDAAAREKLLSDAKPAYHLTGSIHSPETGSPEMLMELVYRLAVDESEHVRAIRRNVITLITPVLEVDGRDRMVDSYRQSRALKLPPYATGLPYWGKYVAHDNNRDGMVLSQVLTQNYMKSFLEWHPTVGHDLHESVPFLYASTGTGPYNDEFDPIVIDEWHNLAYHEITELTRRGLPGIWTHGFYDGWAPNYVLAIANLHNSIGRFYETYTSMGAECHTVNLPAQATGRTWDRPNPPVNGVQWCIRSNINYQQSGVLLALRYTADHRRQFLENAIAKAERTIAHGRTIAPYAFVIPRGQRHGGEAADLVNLFRAQGTEVHEATADFALGEGKKGDTTKPVQVKAGDWVVLLDQPYSQFPRTVLGIQRFKADDPAPYDDTGWTLDELRHVQTIKVRDTAVYTKPLRRLTADARVLGAVKGTGTVLAVRHAGDWRSAVLPWKLGAAKVAVADTAFTVDSAAYPAGTWLVNDAPAARSAIQALGLTAVAIATPTVRQHAVTLPRIALVHSWRETQNEGWVRFSFDKLGIPYTYFSEQQLRTPGQLEKFDVVVYPHVGARTQDLVNGEAMIGPPTPWKKTPATPNLGQWDETNDTRPGMGFDGVAALRRFVERGGMLLVEGATSRFAVDMGFNEGVTVSATRALQARGGVFRAQAETPASPILYGYDQKTFPLFFSQQPVLAVAAPDTGTAGRALTDPAVVAKQDQQRARTIVKWHARADSLLISGMLAGGDEMAGKAAVVDAPLGAGHVIMFGTRPFWRWQTQGAFALAINAIAHWNKLELPPLVPVPAQATK